MSNESDNVIVIKSRKPKKPAEDRETLRENDISNLPAKKSVSIGIGKVQDRLALQFDEMTLGSQEAFSRDIWQWGTRARYTAAPGRWQKINKTVNS